VPFCDTEDHKLTDEIKPPLDSACFGQISPITNPWEFVASCEILAAASENTEANIKLSQTVDASKFTGP